MMLITLNVLCNRCTNFISPKWKKIRFCRIRSSSRSRNIKCLYQLYKSIFLAQKKKETSKGKIMFELYTTQKPMWNFSHFPDMRKIFATAGMAKKWSQSKKVSTRRHFRFMLIKKLLIECDVILNWDATWGRCCNFDNFSISYSNLFHGKRRNYWRGKWKKTFP